MADADAQAYFNFLMNHQWDELADQAVMIQKKPEAYQRRVHQIVSEMGLDELVTMLAECPCGELLHWSFLLSILSHLLTSRAAIKRLVKAKNVMRKITIIFNNSFWVWIHTRVDNYKDLENTIRISIYILQYCALVMKPDAEFWHDLCQCIDLTRAFSWGNNFKVEKERNCWQMKVLQFIHILQTVHIYSLHLGHKMRKHYRLTKFAPIPKDCGARLEMQLSIKKYMVFCSSPKCDKSVHKDGVFRHCSQCMLSRYCSTACQKYHWTHGHRDSCQALEDYEQLLKVLKVVGWCEQSLDGYSCPSRPLWVWRRSTWATDTTDSWSPLCSGLRFNIKTVFPRYRIPMLKIRWSWDRLIFNMGIPILVRRHLYIETAPWCLVQYGISILNWT